MREVELLPTRDCEAGYGHANEISWGSSLQASTVP